MPKTPASLLLGTALAAALAVAATPAGAAPRAGDPDPSFGREGRVVLPYDVQPAAVLTQSDGRLVVPDSTSSRILRLNPDGSLDRSFDGDGLASGNIGAGGKIISVAQQPDGKLLLGGVTASLDAVMVRLNPTGSFDPTFSPGGADGDGKQVNGLAIIDRPSAIIAESDGRIAVFGTSASGAAGIRLDAAGSLEGTVFEPAGAGNVSAAVRAADGTFVAAGTYSGAGDTNNFAARWRDDGKLDTTLAGKGWTSTGAPAASERAIGVLAQPDGKLVLTSDTNSGEHKMGLTRLTAAGTPEGAFGDGGFAAPDFDGDDFPVGAGLQADGKLLIGGFTSPGRQFAAARYTREGRLDPAYGDGGRTTVAFDDVSFAQAAAAQPDGKLVIAGWTVVENRTRLCTALVRLLAADAPVPQGGGEQPGGEQGGDQQGGDQQGGDASQDRTAPSLGRVTLTRTRFTVARAATAVAAAKRGTTIGYRLSEPARVTLRIQRTGARRPAGTLRRAGRAGANRVAFSGRIGRRALRPARYRLTVVATDPAGNRSIARTSRFRIVR